MKPDPRKDELFARARNSFQIGDFEAAERIALSLSQEYPKSAAAQLLLGTVYGRTGEYEKAIAAFRHASELQPRNADAFNNLGVMFRQMGKMSQAIKALERAKTLNPESADVHYNLGNVYKSENSRDLAIQSYKQAIEKNPEFVLAYNNLGTLFMEAGEHGKAAEVFRQGLTADPNHPTLRYNHGLSLQGLGKHDQASQEFEAAIKAKPGWVDCLNNLGITLQQLGRFEESSRIFRQILDIEPKNPTAKNNLAAVMVQQGRKQEASSMYRQVLKENPNYTRAASNLGQLLQTDGGNENDLRDFETLVKVNHQSIPLKTQYAKLLLKNGQVEAAREVLDQAAEMAPESLDVLREKVILNLQSGNTNQAQEQLQKLVRKDPEQWDVLIESARLAIAAGNAPAAQQEATMFLKQNPGDPEAKRVLAEALIMQNKPDKALPYLEDLGNTAPDQGNTIALLARAHQMMGNREKAIEAVDSLINLQGRRANPDDIDQLNASLDLYEKAVAAFEQDQRDVWERNLGLLGKMVEEKSRPEEAVIETLTIDELPVQEEESIPILDFGGEVHIVDDEPQETNPELDKDLMEDLIIYDSLPTLSSLPENKPLFEPSLLPRKDYYPAPEQPMAQEALPPEPPQPKKALLQPLPDPEGGNQTPPPQAQPRIEPQPQPRQQEPLMPRNPEPRTPTAPPMLAEPGGLPQEMESALPPLPQLPADMDTGLPDLAPDPLPSELDPLMEPALDLPLTDLEPPPDWVDPAVDEMAFEDAGLEEISGLDEVSFDEPGELAEFTMEMAAEPSDEGDLVDFSIEPASAFSDQEEIGFDPEPQPSFAPEKGKEAAFDDGLSHPEMNESFDAEVLAAEAGEAGPVLPAEHQDFSPVDGMPQSVARHGSDTASVQPGPSSAAYSGGKSGRPPVNKEESVKLFDYLLGLAGSLPEDVRNSFCTSDMPARIEVLKNKLSGRKGVFKDFDPNGGSRTRPSSVRDLETGKVAKTLEFIHSLSTPLSDRPAASAVREKLKKLLERINPGAN